MWSFRNKNRAERAEAVPESAAARRRSSSLPSVSVFDDEESATLVHAAAAPSKELPREDREANQEAEGGAHDDLDIVLPCLCGHGLIYEAAACAEDRNELDAFLSTMLCRASDVLEDGGREEPEAAGDRETKNLAASTDRAEKSSPSRGLRRKLSTKKRSSRRFFFSGRRASGRSLLDQEPEGEESRREESREDASTPKKKRLELSPGKAGLIVVAAARNSNPCGCLH